MREIAGNTATKKHSRLQNSQSSLERLNKLLTKKIGTDDLARGDVIVSKGSPFEMDIDPESIRCRIIITKRGARSGRGIVCRDSGKAFNDFKDHVEDVAPYAECNSLPRRNTTSKGAAPAARSSR